MVKHLWVIFGLLFGFSVQAEKMALLHPGFYQVSDGPIVYWYSDLVEGDDSGVSAPFAVYEKGYFLRSELSDTNHIELQWKGGVAEISSQSPSETSVDFFDDDHRWVQKKTLSFLGNTQAEVAEKLQLKTKFPITDYLSHRGTAQLGSVKSHSIYPGNTLKSMSLAIENGFSGFEFDIQLTKDGKFAVSHDEKLKVSTNCRGHVIDYTLEEVMKCQVIFTGLLPEKKIFHTRAEVPEYVPSLENVFAKFLPDPRVRHLTIDTKPGDIDTQISAFDGLLKTMALEQQRKLIFLVRDLSIRDQLRAKGYTAPMYALEGSTGYEALETGDLPADADAVSLSIGLGLGFAGFKSGNFARELQVVVSGFDSLVNGLNPFDRDHWRNGTMDIGAIHWSKRNKQKLQALMQKAKDAKVRVIGWTVNTREKIKWLRKYVPSLPYLISDLPFGSIAELEVGELNQAISRPNQ